MLFYRTCCSLFLLTLTALFLSNCGASVYFVHPPDWKEPAKRDSTIRAYSDVMKGTTIFIDPGHGGDDRTNIGPAGDVIDADLNLRIALRLREYLKRAGANVIMSREKDQTVPLEARAHQANVNNADLFISIHHNGADDIYTNYTATFYHSRPGEIGYKPSSHDLARYIQRDLAYVMGNPGSLASFDGTMSDYLIYPGKGFAVLREAKMTAALVECSFFTSAYEEQRLRIPEFNDIEAWGIFRGIGKYLKAGIPKLRYVSPLAFKETRPKIEILASDRADIADESIRVFIDGGEEGFSFNAKTGKIIVSPAEELSHGYHYLTAQVRNSNGNSSAPFEVFFAIGTPPAQLRSSVDPTTLPPDENAFSIVTITALDSAGNALPDGLPIRFRTSTGTDTLLALRDGVVKTYVFPGQRERVNFEASNGPVTTSGVIEISSKAGYARGIVMSADGKPVTNATITLLSGQTTTTNENGEYIITGKIPAGQEVIISAPGYFGKRETLTDSRTLDPVVVSPVARGVLKGKSFVLDLLPPEGGQSQSRVDIRALESLHDLLAASGAIVFSPRTDKDWKKNRQTIIAANRNATIIQFGEQSRNYKITVKSNGQTASRSMGEFVMRTIPEFTAIAPHTFVIRMTGQEEFPKMRQIGLALPVPGAKTYDERLAPLFAWNVAWAVYNSTLASEGYKMKGAKIIEVKVVDKEKKAPAPFVLVELNNALRMMTDGKGVCRFRGVSVPDDDVRALDAEKYEISSVKTEVIN